MINRPTKVRCLEKHRDKNGVILSYKMQRIFSGSCEIITASELKDLMLKGFIDCVNLQLTSDGRLCDKKEETTSPEDLKLKYNRSEIIQYARGLAARQKMMTGITNLEIVFDTFLELRKQEGITYTDKEQLQVYLWMQECHPWNVQTFYIHERYGGALFERTTVTEGTLVLRGFVTGIAQECSVVRRHFESRCGKLKVINQSKITDMSGLFSNGVHFEDLDLSEFTTTGVTNMSNMFKDCTVPKLDLRSFDTSQVVNMDYMFAHMHDIKKLDVSSFDTSNVVSMIAMFSELFTVFDLDLSNFNTSKVAFMQGMFNGCGNITNWKIDKLDTSHVTSMQTMFSHCLFSSAQLKNFDTSSCKSMSYMFTHSRVADVVLDLSHFDTSHVREFDRMFEFCGSITNINLSSFDLRHAVNVSKMFQGCTRLKSVSLDFHWAHVKLVDKLFSDCDSLESISLLHFDLGSITNSDWFFTDPCEKLKTIRLECRGMDRDNRIVKWMLKDKPALEQLDLRGSANDRITEFQELYNKILAKRPNIKINIIC